MTTAANRPRDVPRSTSAREPLVAWLSGSFELLGEVPFQEFALGPVRPVFREGDELPGLGVEPLAVAEILTQPWADPQPVGGIDAEVAAVEQGVDVRSQEKAVVQAMLTACADRADVSRLQDGPYLRAGNRTATAVSIEYDGLERSLTKTVRCQTRVAKHRARPVPGLAEVEFECPTQEHLQKLSKVGRDRGF